MYSAEEEQKEKQEKTKTDMNTIIKRITEEEMGLSEELFKNILIFQELVICLCI